MKIFSSLILLVFLGLLCPLFLDDISTIRNILSAILCIYAFSLYRYYRHKTTSNIHHHQDTHYKASNL